MTTILLYGNKDFCSISADTQATNQRTLQAYKSVAGSSPTNAELSTGGNWERVYESKNVRIVQFKHKLWTPTTTVAGGTGE